MGYEVNMERIIHPSLRCDLFATRADVGLAISYAQQAIQTLEPKDIPLMLTSLQVLLNTFISEEDKRDSN